MPDPIFERYKEALRAGHVAALRGMPDDALQHYRVAASIAPDRALPHIGMADVLLRLGRHDDALAASTAALRLAPFDEAGLDMTARIHAAAGRGADAAACLDQLVDIRERQGRTDDARVAAFRANEADPTDVRRDRLGALRSAVDAERARLADPGWAADAADRVGGAEALAPTGAAASSSRPAVEAPPMTPATPAAPPAVPPPASPVRVVVSAAPAKPVASAGDVAPVGPAAAVAPVAPGAPRDPPARAKPAPQAGAPAEPAAPGEPAGHGSAARAQPSVSESSEPDVPDALFVAAENLAPDGNAKDAARLYVQASARYLEAGAADTAVDACLRALATAPAETDVHLALARIDLATGHDERAAEKLDLLDRLLALEGDEEGLTRVAAFRERTSSPGGGTLGPRHARRASGS